MTPWFWITFLSTVMALLVVLFTGRRAMRRWHFLSVAIFVTLLGITIVLTEALMGAVKFPRNELDFHLKFAFSATFLLAPVVVTGVGLAKCGGRGWRVGHRVAVVVFVLAVLSAIGTGIWAFSLAE